MSKKALIISYVYPPAPGGGSPRLVRITKALKNAGFEPVVITVKQAISRGADPDLLEEVKNLAQIERTESLDPKRLAYIAFSRKKSPAKDAVVSPFPQKGFFKRLWKAFSKFRNWLLIPDEYIGFVPFATARAIKFIRKEKPSIIITSTSPHSVQLAGLILKKLFKIPWLVDFRDAWARHPYYFYPTRFHRWLSAKMEKWVIKNADLVLFAYGLQEAKNTYPELKEKFKPLANAYSEKDFQKQKPIELEGFSLLYIGAFYGAHSPEKFFRALKDLIFEQTDIKSEIKVWMIGQFFPEHIEMVKKYNLENIVYIKDFVPHNKVISWLCSAKVLLLFLGSDVKNSIVIPGKVFEYMRAPGWILAMIPEGETAQILRKAGGALVVNGNDIKAIKHSLYQLYLFYKQGKKPERNQKYILQFEEKEFEKKFIEYLYELVKP